MAFERTLTIIKPDAVANNAIGKITALIEDSGLHVIAAKMLHLSTEEAGKFYLEHKGRLFYDPLIEFMTSGPVMIQIIEGEDAIQILRNMMGATVPKQAAPGTIRYLYADHDFNGKVHENAIHGSDSLASAEREIDFFFKAGEICPRTR